MTTTAHEDQFTDAPEPVRQPYDTGSILRRNVADIEIALKQQAERAEAAEAELLAVRDDNHSMMLEIDGLRKELAKLREQKPVAWDCGGSITANSGYAEWFSRKDHGDAVPLYTSPVPAPAVPDDIHELAYELGGTDSGEYHLEPEALDKIIAAVQVMAAAPAPAVLAVPDGDDFNGSTPHLIQCMEALVRLDADGVLVPHGIGRDASKLLSAAANRLRKQPAPAVPSGWNIRRDGDVLIVKHPDIGGCSVQREPDWERMIPEAILYSLADALLQSAPTGEPK